MAEKIYDYAIIGAGLSGVSLANKLAQETSSVALIEALDTFGGNNKKINFPTGPINNGLRFFPATNSTEKALLFIENQLGLSLIKNKLHRPPVTFESGQIKPFLGFGDTSPDFYEELVYFLNEESYELHLQPFEWLKLLFEKFQGEFIPKSYVTKIQVQGERVESLVLNGSKNLKAQNYIFCGSVRDLVKIIPEGLGAKQKQKLSKAKTWAAICLDLCHSHVVTDLSNIHLLNGTTQDDIGPCVGQFLPTLPPVNLNEPQMQTSQWMTFVDSAATEDSEIAATALKKIKRQIKRAYPQALEALQSERISLITNYSHLNDFALQGQQTLPGIENLWIGSGQVRSEKNITGSLLQAELVLSALGFSASIDQETEGPR